MDDVNFPFFVQEVNTGFSEDNGAVDAQKRKCLVPLDDLLVGMYGFLTLMYPRHFLRDLRFR